MTEPASISAEESPAAISVTGIDGERPFDFLAHRQKAIEEYQTHVPLYADFARAVYSILKTCLENDDIKVHSIQYRAKTLDSFGDKAQTPAEQNPNRPKYDQPLSQITDLAGVRIITHFLSTEAGVDRMIPLCQDSVRQPASPDY